MIGYRYEIDGLRALAVAGVVFYHAGYLSGGYVGVDVFLVISGYVITLKLLDLRSRDGAWIGRFVAGRARRIVPLLMIVLLACFVPAFFLMWPGQFHDFSRGALSAALFVSNVFFLFQDPYQATGNQVVPLIHTWSLGVEIQLYLLLAGFFALYAGRPSGRNLPAAVALISTLSFALAEMLPRDQAFYLPISRFWEFGAGAILALLPTTVLMARHRTSSLLAWAGLILIVGSGWTFDAETHHPGIPTLFPVLGAMAIIACCDRNHLLGRILGFYPFWLIGAASYSLYLWHQPIFAFLRLAHPAGVDAATIWLAIALSVAISLATWRWIEQPFRSANGDRWRTEKRQSIVAASALLLAVALWGGSVGTSSAKFAVHSLIYEPERGDAIVDGEPCKVNVVDDACIIGDTSKKPTFALLGDSHILTQSASIGELLASHHQSAAVMTMLGCPFIEGVLRYTYPRDCQSHAEKVFEALRARGIRNVIINDYRNAYLTGLTGKDSSDLRATAVYSVAAGKESASRLEDVLTLQRETLWHLLDAGIHVYFIATVPDAPFMIPNAVREKVVSGGLPVTFDLAPYLKRSQALSSTIEQFRTNPNFTVIYPHKALCPGADCMTHSATRLYYTDDNHLSEDGAKLLVPLLEKALFLKG